MLLKTLAAALLVLTAGCGSPARGPVDRPQAEVRTAISGLTSDYESARAEAFFERFDKGRFPGFDAFRQKTRDFLMRNRQVVLNVVVDGVETSGDASGARVHWNRSFVDPSGSQKQDAGQGELVFRRTDAGEFKLANIHGDSPF
jgi:hypothetical protein